MSADLFLVLVIRLCSYCLLADAFPAGGRRERALRKSQESCKMQETPRQDDIGSEKFLGEMGFLGGTSYAWYTELLRYLFHQMSSLLVWASQFSIETPML